MSNGRIQQLSELLVGGLTDEQEKAVRSQARLLLIIAGAGSGKTEVMSRRVAWWLGVEGVPKDRLVAFTFTDAAAEELKFRIRRHIEQITPRGEDPTLGGMYIGTIHGFCIKTLRDLAPETYYNFDILDEAGRMALLERGFHSLLGLNSYQQAAGIGKYEAVNKFLAGYDLLNEYDLLDVRLPDENVPNDVADEREWCRHARLITNVGETSEAEAFSLSAARFYAYLRARRLLDFSTSQSELTRLLRTRPELIERLRSERSHIVVDEVQDINPVQDVLIRELVGDAGALTAVGDHRQAIYAFRGGRVELMARMNRELAANADGDVITLPDNFRSTPMIIGTANRWADTIGAVGGLTNPHMTHQRDSRTDLSQSHVGTHTFHTRQEEADWIAETVLNLVRSQRREGVVHDLRVDDEVQNRGIGFSDVAVLVRSSTDVLTYLETLRERGIPAVVRGAGLFSQAEVLLCIGVLAKAAGLDSFYGSRDRSDSLPGKIHAVLGCPPYPQSVIQAACENVARQGLTVAADSCDRLIRLADAINQRISEGGPPSFPTDDLVARECVLWAQRRRVPRRVFPQQLFHWILEEIGVAEWDAAVEIGRTAMFHIGQLSSLIKSMETPGWTTAGDLKYQIIALCMWGAKKARASEAPLLVPPDAVTVTTVHSAKGLEFATVFLADVNARRFPSNWATKQPSLPFSGHILRQINPNDLADNQNKDNERRLMYVALTRAERYLFVTCSGTNRQFIDPLRQIIRNEGGIVATDHNELARELEYAHQTINREQRLSTSFSDIRYYLECPHDFYLRKVLGFAPTIDQTFGYGQGIHNILREIHMNPNRWAALTDDPERLRDELEVLVFGDLFYLRYTTGEPLRNMRAAAIRGLREYVGTYAQELNCLEFEPEREFETLFQEEQVLISGAIDLVRLDDPPRVTIIDFKSGEHADQTQSGLNEEMMRLQIGIYGLAAREELEYEPDRGLVRYLGETDPERRESEVVLTDEELEATRIRMIGAARSIRSREFDAGPSSRVPDRCRNCDMLGICGRPEADAVRSGRG